MDLSDIAALAAQINMVETPLFESSSRMFQNPEELSKHCMDLIRERPVSRENPMATVQFLSGCDIRGDKLRSLAAASIKVASAAHPVRYEPYAVVAAAAAANSAAAATAAATTPFSGFGKSVWASTDLGDFTKFVLSRHEEILTCALRGSSSAVEALSLNEYTKFVADEWARVSDVSGNDRLFPAGKGMKPELREVVKLYYDAASRVASPLPSPGGVAGVCEDFLMHVPNEMPAVHPHAKAATTLWRTLRAVLPPRGSDRSRWGLSVLAGNGMAFLQRKFAGIIESTVNANLRRACVSSSAGFEAKVDGFLKVIGKGYNEWGKVYYLVLSGKYDVALSLFTDKASPVERALSNFCTNTPIADGVYEQLLRARSNPRNDRYLNTILSVLLRDISGVPQLGSVDELLWVTLAIARGSGICCDEGDGIAHDAMARICKRLEASRNDFAGSPYVYAASLALIGRFKESAEYLWASKDPCVQIDAAHIALAIALRIPRPGQLSYADETDEESGSYGSDGEEENGSGGDGECEDEAAAAGVFSTSRRTRRGGGMGGLAAALSRIIEAYPARVGLNKKGATPYLNVSVMLPGGTTLIRQFLDESSLASSADGLSKMLKESGKSPERYCVVAEALAAEGSIKKAMYLFNSVGEYGRAARLLYTLLGSVVPLPKGEPERHELLKFAEALERHREEDTTLRTLRAMSEFFDLFHDGKWVDAVTRPDFCGLLPSTDCSVEAVEKCARRFLNVFRTPKEVAQNVPGVLVAMMVCIKHCCTGASYTDKIIRIHPYERATALITFAALVSERLPPETSAALLRVKEQIERN